MPILFVQTMSNLNFELKLWYRFQFLQQSANLKGRKENKVNGLLFDPSWQSLSGKATWQPNKHEPVLSETGIKGPFGLQENAQKTNRLFGKSFCWGAHELSSKRCKPTNCTQQPHNKIHGSAWTFPVLLRQKYKFLFRTMAYSRCVKHLYA